MSILSDPIGSVTGTISQAEKQVKSTLEKVSSYVTGSLEEVMSNAISLIKPFSDVQTAAAELARSIGISNANIIGMSTNLIRANREQRLSERFNWSNEEMLKIQKDIMAGLGRNAAIDMMGPESTLSSLMAGSRLIGPEMMSQIATGYDKIGISMNTAGDVVGKLFREAGEYGINLQLYSKNFASNLAMVQKYNFRNGVDGLREMARKATEIRQDMQQVANFADKVGTVTGAVETAARLQVLGGSFTAMANPLAMLNESLTDMNGLQDRLTEMTKGAATYNSRTHQVEIDPFTRMQIKAAAEAAGLNADNLFEQATAQARRGEIENQMRGMGIDDDLRKLLLNAGQIDKNGVAGATVNGEFRSIAEIAGSPDLRNQLFKENTTEEQNVQSIAENVLSIAEVITGKGKQIANEQAYMSTQPGIVGGKSTYDTALGVIQSVDAEVISAAAKIDEYSKNILEHWTNFEASVLTSAIKPFNATSPKEFGEKLGDALGDILGPRATEWGNTIGEKAAEVIEGVADKIKEYGADPLAYFREGNGAAKPITAGAITTNTITVTPSSAANAGAAAGAAGTGTVLAPTTGGGSIGRVEFTGNKSSVPSAEVTPEGKTNPGSNKQSVASTPADSGPLVIRLDGHVAVDVVGDNGKIGTEDLMKILRENPTFMQELANMIASQCGTEVRYHGTGN